jgi:hypothetical protein
MAEQYGLSVSPVLVVDLRAVLRRDRAHRLVLLLGLQGTSHNLRADRHLRIGNETAIGAVFSPVGRQVLGQMTYKDSGDDPGDYLGQLGAEHIAQLSARCDAKFGKGAVEVGADRAVREVKLLADLSVGESRGSHAGDLELLWRQIVERIAFARVARYASASQFVLRPLDPSKSV